MYVRTDPNSPLDIKLTNSNTGHTASATITITTGAAHSAGDVVSTDTGEILEFDTGLTAGGSGYLVASRVTLDQNAVFSGGAGYTLYLFTESPTAQATNAAFDMADADLPMYADKILISKLEDLGANCVATDQGHNMFFKLAAADTKLYGKLVCNGGETTITAAVLGLYLGFIPA